MAPIQANGQLDLAAVTPVNALVSSATNLTVTTDASGGTPGTRVVYTAAFTDVNGNVIATRTAMAHTRTRPIF